MWGEVLRHELRSGFDVIKASDVDPQRFTSGLAVAFVTEKSPKAGHHADGFSARGRYCKKNVCVPFSWLLIFVRQCPEPAPAA